MKRISRILLLALAVSAPAGGYELPDELLALHFLPETADQARQLTLAAAVALERMAESETVSGEALARRVATERVMLDAYASIVPEYAPADGYYPRLVGPMERFDADRFDTDHETAFWDEDAPILKLLAADTEDTVAAMLAARWRTQAERRAIEVWRGLGQQVDGDAASAIRALWDEYSDQAEPSENYSRALELARLTRALDEATPDERSDVLTRLRLMEAEHLFAQDRVLAAVWSLLGLLTELADQPPPALALGEHLAMLAEQYGPALRRVDPGLLTVMALLGDAAVLDDAHALADAYGQMALFIPDAGFYLDQPVRQGIRDGLAVCRDAADDGEILQRAPFDACLAALFGTVAHDARTVELAGDANGPFAPEHLRRELGLVSWQRIRYLLGYLDWILGSHCPAPDLFNVLETAVGVEQISQWTKRRMVYFRSERWQQAAIELRGNLAEAAVAVGRWSDCITGSGGARRDPVERLIAVYRLELQQLHQALAAAQDQFREQVLSPGADVMLTAGPEQATNWRPEGLRVMPCDPARTCGMTAALPVSRALLGKFPQPYLLAAQTGMGAINICYDNVQWTDRRQEPARRNDERVSNYSGHLSFELAGRYKPRGGGDDEAEARDVFRLRLTTPERYPYLFAANAPEVLEDACPVQRIGQSIPSELPQDRAQLVPNRLTYFTTALTTASGLIGSNWDRGAEWRDWFLTDRHVERLNGDDGAHLMSALDAHLRRLALAQERNVLGRLLRPPVAGETDPLSLNMSRLSDLKALIRRALELVHPMVLRYHDDIRSAFAGEAALLDREQARRLRDQGLSPRELPRIALARTDTLRALWLDQPEALRHGGQPSPELIHALLRLAELDEQP